MEHKYLVSDFVIFEDVCNGQCKYCITGSSFFKENHETLRQNDNLKFRNSKLREFDNTYSDGSRLRNNIDSIISSIKENADSFILKISGGEIFLIKGIVDFIEAVAKDFHRIQIITNGFLLQSSLIERLSKISNLSLQISMDGHNLELNRYRVRDSVLQNRLNNTIKECCSYNIPVEINCVITDANLDKLYEFADFLNQYDNVLFLPYLIRGSNREAFLPKREQISGLGAIIRDYEKYKNILPPKAYLEALYNFILDYSKGDKCYLPRLIYQCFDDGTLTPCSNIWFKSFGNILDNPKPVFNRLSEDSFYDVIDKHMKVLEHCRYCFTPWEIVNLYLDNRITEQEMRRIYLYDNDEIISYLNKQKIERCSCEF